MTDSAWFAAGKHPCARDFFRVGEAFPLAVSLARWVETGYQGGAAEQPQRRSWRFWAAAGELLCYGLLADSRDALGRPFPLLLAGQERARGWQRAWESVPAALAQSWTAMEGVAAGSPDLATLETRLCGPGIGEPPSPAPAAESGLPPLRPGHEGDVATLLCPAGEGMGLEFVAAAHAALKRRGRVPASVFIGGLAEAPRITFFYRALATRDFTALWSGGEDAGDGATC